MRAGCRSFSSVSAWRSFPVPNRFCMRFYCPIEANPGPGLQKTVDNFMTINSIWSKESVIITWGCSARVFLPESLGWGGGSEHLSKTHQTHWGPLGYLHPPSLKEDMWSEGRWAPRKVLGSPAFIKPFLGTWHVNPSKCPSLCGGPIPAIFQMRKIEGWRGQVPLTRLWGL